MFKLDEEFQVKGRTYPEYKSMLKNTYSPLSIMFKSSAANMISLIVPGLAHIITTEMDFFFLGDLNNKIGLVTD